MAETNLLWTVALSVAAIVVLIIATFHYDQKVATNIRLLLSLSLLCVAMLKYSDYTHDIKVPLFQTKAAEESTEPEIPADPIIGYGADGSKYVVWPSKKAEYCITKDNEGYITT